MSVRSILKNYYHIIERSSCFTNNRKVSLSIVTSTALLALGYLYNYNEAKQIPNIPNPAIYNTSSILYLAATTASIIFGMCYLRSYRNQSRQISIEEQPQPQRPRISIEEQPQPQRPRIPIEEQPQPQSSSELAPSKVIKHPAQRLIEILHNLNAKSYDEPCNEEIHEICTLINQIDEENLINPDYTGNQTTLLHRAVRCLNNTPLHIMLNKISTSDKTKEKSVGDMWSTRNGKKVTTPLLLSLKLAVKCICKNNTDSTIFYDQLDPCLTKFESLLHHTLDANEFAYKDVDGKNIYDYIDELAESNITYPRELLFKRIKELTNSSSNEEAPSLSSSETAPRSSSSEEAPRSSSRDINQTADRLYDILTKLRPSEYPKAKDATLTLIDKMSPEGLVAPNSQNRYKYTFLHLAVSSGQPELLLRMLEKINGKLSVNIFNESEEYKTTPLLLALSTANSMIYKGFDGNRSVYSREEIHNFAPMIKNLIKNTSNAEEFTYSDSNDKSTYDYINILANAGFVDLKTSLDERIEELS